MSNFISRELEIIGSLLSVSGNTFLGESSANTENDKFARIDLGRSLSKFEIENHLKSISFINSDNAETIATKLFQGCYNSAIVDDGILAIINEMPNGDTVVWLVTDSFLELQLKAIAYEKSFPNSEIKLIKQLVSGMSISQAAKVDNLGYETKKGYYKSIASKLQINSQTQLVSKVILHLVEGIDRAINRFNSTDNSSLLKRIHKDARLFSTMDDKEQQSWILDYGQVNETPVIWFAQQALTPFQQNELEVLEELGLRVLIPVRPGSLQPNQEKLSNEEYNQRIQFAAKQALLLSGKEKVDVVGIISGGMYAIDFCLQHPENVKSLYLFGTYSASKKPTGISALFRTAAMAMTSKSPVISEQLFNHLAKKLTDPDLAKKFFLKLYKDSQPDIDFVEQEFNPASPSTNLMEVFVNSRKSVEMDFQKLYKYDWNLLKKIPVPKLLIHGELDSLYHGPTCKEFADKTNSTLKIMPNCGQLAFGLHFKNMMDIWRHWQK